MKVDNWVKRDGDDGVDLFYHEMFVSTGSTEEESLAKYL